MIVENRIAGTRITVWDVLHHLEHGWAIDEIAEILDLSVEHVRGAAEYINAHRSEVMRIHHEIEARNARGNTPEVEELARKAHTARMKWQEQRETALTS